MGFSHIGGFKIELLDQKDDVMLTLASNLGSDNDRTQTHYEVLIPPNVECINCGLRLVREAQEWGETYLFWSCADIDIKRAPTDKERQERKKGLCITKNTVKFMYNKF